MDKKEIEEREGGVLHEIIKSALNAFWYMSLEDESNREAIANLIVSRWKDEKEDIHISGE
jgi:hypothetical protein